MHRAADVLGDLLSPPVMLTQQQVEIAMEENRRTGNTIAKEAAAVQRWEAYTDQHEQLIARHEQQQRQAKEREDQYTRLQHDRGEGRERER